MYITLLLCSYFHQRDFTYSMKFQVAYFGLSYSRVRKIPWRRDRLPLPVFLGFPYGSAGKESAWNAGDLGSVPGLGRSSGEGNVYLIQYSGLENSMDCIVNDVAKSWTWLSNFHLNCLLKALSPSAVTFEVLGSRTSIYEVRGSGHNSAHNSKFSIFRLWYILRLIGCFIFSYNPNMNLKNFLCQINLFTFLKKVI